MSCLDDCDKAAAAYNYVLYKMIVIKQQQR